MFGAFGMAVLIDNNFVLINVGRAHDHHSFELVLDILFQILLINELRKVKFGIDQQVIWFLAKVVKIILHQFINCSVEISLVHTYSLRQK